MNKKYIIQFIGITMGIFSILSIPLIILISNLDITDDEIVPIQTKPEPSKGTTNNEIIRQTIRRVQTQGAKVELEFVNPTLRDTQTILDIPYVPMPIPQRNITINENTLTEVTEDELMYYLQNTENYPRIELEQNKGTLVTEEINENLVIIHLSNEEGSSIYAIQQKPQLNKKAIIQIEKTDGRVSYIDVWHESNILIHKIKKDKESGILSSVISIYDMKSGTKPEPIFNKEYEELVSVEEDIVYKDYINKVFDTLIYDEGKVKYIER